jgi:hypothetical protein
VWTHVHVVIASSTLHATELIALSMDITLRDV